MKKIYICTTADKEEFYKKKARTIYLGQAEIVDSVEKAEMIFVVDLMEKDMSQEIMEMDIPCIRMTEQFIPMDIYTAVLNNSLQLPKAATTENRGVRIEDRKR